MTINEIRIYCECYEQGLYLSEYFNDNALLTNIKLSIVYTKSSDYSGYIENSLVAMILKVKDLDALISFVDDDGFEHPQIIIEFSTAVPVDDHVLQRFDVIYWASFFNVVAIKISPSEITNTNFGGGNKIKKNHEMYAALNISAVYYHFDWPIINNSDIVISDKDNLTCPPKYEELSNVIHNITESFYEHYSYSEAFNSTFIDYEFYVRKNFIDEDLIFNNSPRYNFNIHHKYLDLKFNRYGHGMDPEKGALIFWSCKLLGNVDINFIVQRESIDGYRKLYDGSGWKNIEKIIRTKVLINKNIINPELAFELFIKSTSTFKLFQNSTIVGSNIIINNDSLIKYLSSGPSVINILLNFANSISLKDLKGITIGKITWDKNIVKKFYENKKKLLFVKKYKKLPLTQLTKTSLNEDIITYIFVQVMRKNGMFIIATSYPGAQGDRKILSGSGRMVKREYIDIISLKKINDHQYDIVLQENKQYIASSNDDVDKLNNFIRNSEKTNNLNNLIKVVHQPIEKNKYYVGIGGQFSKFTRTDIDYIMCLELLPDNEFKWSIMGSSKDIFTLFENVLDSNGNMKGIYKLKIPIYQVNKL